jgi:WD40 repeat protein
VGRSGFGTSTGKARSALKGHENAVRCVAFSPDGKALASGGGDWSRPGKPGEVKLWDLDEGKERVSLPGHADYVYAVAFTPDGKALATGSRDGTLKVWDAATGKERFTHTGKEAVTSLAFTPDGRTLLTGQGLANTAGTVKVWDVAAGTERATLKECMYGVLAVATAADGKAWAAGSLDWTVTLWDVTSGK